MSAGGGEKGDGLGTTTALGGGGGAGVVSTVGIGSGEGFFGSGIFSGSAFFRCGVAVDWALSSFFALCFDDFLGEGLGDSSSSLFGDALFVFAAGVFAGSGDSSASDFEAFDDLGFGEGLGFSSSLSSAGFFFFAAGVLDGSGVA